MMGQNQIQTYINNFRRRITPFLLPGIGLHCKIFPSSSGGAILVFKIGVNIENDDVYEPESPSLGNALSKIEQRAFGGNLEGFKFGGTNVVLEQNQIIFIKDGTSEEWTDKAAEKDAQSVLSPIGRGRK